LDKIMRKIKNVERASVSKKKDRALRDRQRRVDRVPPKNEIGRPKGRPKSEIYPGALSA
jgi:hypothetical protein